MNTAAFDAFPELTSERLRLRAMDDADLPMIYAFNADVEALRYVPREPYTTTAEAEAKLQGFTDGFAERKGVWWAYETLDDGETIGYGGLFDVAAADRKAEIGYGLLPAFWRLGYVSEAVAAMTRFGLETLELHRLYGYVDPENVASARVLRRLGYEHEGTMRHAHFARGRFFDMDVFGLVDAD